jgi:DNA-3-methyladenine glycosylase
MARIRPGAKLPPSFYAQEPTALARSLLGQRLVRVYRGRAYGGYISETEAYLGPEDPACHTFGGRQTPRVKSMYLGAGHAYVYFIYGMHFCFNVVAAKPGAAVLVRGLIPDEHWRGPPPRLDGPARLCKALRIARPLDGARLDGDTVFVEQSARLPDNEEIGVGARIGVGYAGAAADWPLRFTWRRSERQDGN